LLTNHPRLLKDICAVVIDELHIFDNTPRGDQLRILLNRLRRLKKYALSRGDVTSEAIQYCALSATIADPAEVARRYFDNPLVIQISGQREIDAELLELENEATLQQLFTQLKQRGDKKVLAFCNSRAECEEWAYRLRVDTPFGDRIYVHHASLDANVRRAVENNFTLTEAALCFATSTLELGIDIGDVDLILLIGPPGNLSAFLQRIGRGNRRTSRTSVVCCYRTQTDLALFQIFLRATESGGEIATPQPYFFRASIVVQQLFSYLKQTRLGEIEPDTAFELFASVAGEPLLPKKLYDEIIEHLSLKQFFLSSHNKTLRPGPAWNELYEQRAIYTNLLDTKLGTIDVIDEETGRKLGEMERRAVPGETFIFGGQARQASRIIGRKLVVKTTGNSAPASAPRLRSPWRPMPPALARAVAMELGAPRTTNSNEIAMMVENVEQDDAATEKENLTTWIFHCAGDAYGMILGDLLEKLYRVRIEDYNDLYLAVQGEIPIDALTFTPDQVRACLRRRWQKMEGWYELGRFQSFLPLEARRTNVIEAFDVVGFVNCFGAKKFTQLDPA
jgi:ATP-dependent helicase Lhr and Lhr-like helicase